MHSFPVNGRTGSAYPGVPPFSPGIRSSACYSEASSEDSGIRLAPAGGSLHSFRFLLFLFKVFKLNHNLPYLLFSVKHPVRFPSVFDRLLALHQLFYNFIHEPAACQSDQSVARINQSIEEPRGPVSQKQPVQRKKACRRDRRKENPESMFPAAEKSAQKRTCRDHGHHKRHGNCVICHKKRAAVIQHDQYHIVRKHLIQSLSPVFHFGILSESSFLINRYLFIILSVAVSVNRARNVLCNRKAISYCTKTTARRFSRRQPPFRVRYLTISRRL